MLSALNLFAASFLVEIFLAESNRLASIPITSAVTLSSKNEVSKTVNCPSLESFPSGVPFSWKIPHVFAASNLLEIALIESGL